MTAETTPDRQPSQAMRQIGLWGAPQSGKTTFLAALNVAVARYPGDLLLYGRDDEATEFLAEHTDMLTTQRSFPAATVNLRPLSWTLQTRIQVPQERKLRKPIMTTVPFRLNIELLDAAGADFSAIRTATGAREGALFGEENDEDAYSAGTDDELMDHLAACDGIVLLFDPLRERTVGDAYRYFQGTLLRIAQRRLGQGGTFDKLPQYLAICVTKFDDPTVYMQAKRGGYRSFDESSRYLFPRVRDDSAARFFDELSRKSDRGNSELMARGISQFFRPERIRYFITSAIGFHLGTSRIFREQDYLNTVEGADGVTRIRGSVYPINVVEPLLWLCQNLGTAPRV